MSSFQFNPVTPHPLLRQYVEKMYVFESSGRLPELDNKLIVPNANFKLTLTYRNGIEARIADKIIVQKQNEISLSGLIDKPVILDPNEDSQTGTIIIEFKPLGAYRLFHLPYSELKNQIINLTDLLGSIALKLQQQLEALGSVDLKLNMLQQFLIRQLDRNTEDIIFDYCTKRITDSSGMITIAKLEKETGYTARWLNKKFMEHLGSSPKNLCEIIRFKQFYQVYSSTQDPHALKGPIYHFYYDQSHFIRAFKRFTGFSPGVLQQSKNELATKHYTS